MFVTFLFYWLYVIIFLGHRSPVLCLDVQMPRTCGALSRALLFVVIAVWCIWTAVLGILLHWCYNYWIPMCTCDSYRHYNSFVMRWKRFGKGLIVSWLGWHWPNLVGRVWGRRFISVAAQRFAADCYPTDTRTVWHWLDLCPMHMFWLG